MCRAVPAVCLLCACCVQEDEATRRAKLNMEVKRHLGGVLVEVTDALIGACVCECGCGCVCVGGWVGGWVGDGHTLTASIRDTCLDLLVLVVLVV